MATLSRRVPYNRLTFYSNREVRKSLLNSHDFATPGPNLGFSVYDAQSDFYAARLFGLHFAGWFRWAAAGAGSVPDEGAPAGQVRPPGPGHQAEAAGRLLFFFLIFFGLHKNHPKSAKHCRYFCFVSKLKTFYNQVALFLNFLKFLYNLSLDFCRMRETNFQFSFLKEELFYMS